MAIFPGVTAAIFAVMSCLLDANDAVVIVDPLYVGYEPIMNALNVNVTTVPARAAHGFEPQYDDIVAAVTERTRVVFINTPANRRVQS